MKKKNKRNKGNKKWDKVIKIAIIALVVILVGELIYFGYKVYSNRKNSTFYTVTNSMVLTKEGYVGAGFSDYKKSKFNEFENGYNKATIFVNKNKKTVKEIGYKKGFNSYFNDLIQTKDGYVAVGSIEVTKKQNKNSLSEGLIIKYDKNFKIVWKKNISALDKTDLLKVKLDKNNNIIIVGSSTYGEGYIGNHKNGGAILLKLNQKGKELLRVNWGGPYSGQFNDVLVEDDGYVAVGFSSKNNGLIIKYNTAGKKLWTGTYGYTDKNGITGIDKIGNKYYVSTTKMIDKTKIENYQAAVVAFNKTGEKIDEVKYSSNKITTFSDIQVTNDKKIIVCGTTGKIEDNKTITDAVIVKYDKDLYEEKSTLFKEKKNDLYKQIVLNKDRIIVLGYTNSKINNGNGYEYFPFVVEYTKNLKQKNIY